MDANEEPVRVNTAGHPRESDRKFFNLLRFIVEMRCERATAMIMCSTLKGICKSCNEVHVQLVTFTFNHN